MVTRTPCSEHSKRRACSSTPTQASRALRRTMQRRLSLTRGPRHQSQTPAPSHSAGYNPTAHARRRRSNCGAGMAHRALTSKSVAPGRFKEVSTRRSRPERSLSKARDVGTSNHEESPHGNGRPEERRNRRYPPCGAARKQASTRRGRSKRRPRRRILK